MRSPSISRRQSSHITGSRVRRGVIPGGARGHEPGALWRDVAAPTHQRQNFKYLGDRALNGLLRRTFWHPAIIYGGAMFQK